MKASVILILITAALAIGWRLASGDRPLHSVSNAGGGDAIKSATVHTGPTIEQVQALACLVTSRVSVADVEETTLEGYTGAAKAALLIKGDYLLSVDLAQAKFESLDQAARTAVLLLPQPKVTSPRLDHERTRIFMVQQTGLWRITPGGSQATGKVVDRAYRDAQRFVATACDDPAMISRSRQQAEQVLSAFFGAMGWKVAIRWQT